MTENHFDITSTGNPSVKFLVHLRKKRERERSGLIAIEGIREIEAALESGAVLKEIYYCPAIAEAGIQDLLSRKAGKPETAAVSVSRAVFEKIAYRSTTEGVVALAEKPARPLENMVVPENPLYLVIDGAEKPGNIGALFRTADAAGASGVIASGVKTDLFNPNLIRASLGTVFTVSSALEEAPETIRWLKRNGIAIIVTTPGGTGLYTDIDYTLPSAVVVGSEDSGLGGEWFDAADVKTRIPMEGWVDSLNVSVAGAVILYEASRQRRIRFESERSCSGNDYYNKEGGR